MSIQSNLDFINAQVNEAIKKSGREKGDVTLIGVTKTIDTDRINELLNLGITDIGENKVQEFLPKQEVLADKKVNWHFLGNLQRNKVKFIVDKVHMIHSVDSEKLADEINRRCQQVGKRVKIFFEVNIAKEISKHGIPPESVLQFAEKLLNMRFLEPVGLMCIAPFTDTPEKNRSYFEKMRKLGIDINRLCLYDTFSCLSMGMTNDYQVAVEEGATHIRVGTGIFGSRL